MGRWIPVLAIDDDVFIRKALKLTLQLYGFEVYLAENGPTGVKLAREKRPTFILLDWTMPEMDGLEVLSELKHDKRTENIPVFMLTDRGMIGDIDQAFEIGADDYITKPLDLIQLGKIVKTKWEKYSQSADVR
ncbi:MAG: response regulator [Desulfobacteraceae bacterium]|nr:response regulator [Desulfobacteraceae bacterium]